MLWLVSRITLDKKAVDKNGGALSPLKNHIFFSVVISIYPASNKWEWMISVWLCR